MSMDGEFGLRALLWSGGSLLSDCDLFPADCVGDQGSAGGRGRRLDGTPLGTGAVGLTAPVSPSADCASWASAVGFPPRPVAGVQLGRSGEPSALVSSFDGAALVGTLLSAPGREL